MRSGFSQDRIPQSGDSQKTGIQMILIKNGIFIFNISRQHRKPLGNGYRYSFESPDILRKILATASSLRSSSRDRFFESGKPGNILIGR